jgi:hypothetical protein
VENELHSLIQHGKSEYMKIKIKIKKQKNYTKNEIIVLNSLASVFMQPENDSLSTFQANPGQRVYNQKKQFTH